MSIFRSRDTNKLKESPLDQWKRIESPEINLYLSGQLIYNKEGKHIQWGKVVSSIHDVAKTGQLHAKD